jgi:hypothetical protein
MCLCFCLSNYKLLGEADRPFGVNLSLPFSLSLSLSLSIKVEVELCMCVCLYVPEKIGDFLFYLFSFFGVDFVKKMGD